LGVVAKKSVTLVWDKYQKWQRGMTLAWLWHKLTVMFIK